MICMLLYTQDTIGPISKILLLLGTMCCPQVVKVITEVIEVVNVINLVIEVISKLFN